MSLRHALIGLLAEKPASGWDLTRRFEELLGTVWPAGHPQIYGELRKLEADGFIQMDSEGPRRRKAYRATEAGIEEVRRWLTSVDVDHTLRLEPVLRSVFFWLMTPEELVAYLEKEAAFYRDLAAKYRALAAAKDRGEFGDSPQTRSIRIAAEAGIRLHEALGDWATWAETHQPNLKSLSRTKSAFSGQKTGDRPGPGRYVSGPSFVQGSDSQHEEEPDGYAEAAGKRRGQAR